LRRGHTAAAGSLRLIKAFVSLAQQLFRCRSMLRKCRESDGQRDSIESVVEMPNRNFYKFATQGICAFGGIFNRSLGKDNGKLLTSVPADHIL